MSFYQHCDMQIAGETFDIIQSNVLQGSKVILDVEEEGLDKRTILSLDAATEISSSGRTCFRSSDGKEHCFADAQPGECNSVGGGPEGRRQLGWFKKIKTLVGNILNEKAHFDDADAWATSFDDLTGSDVAAISKCFPNCVAEAEAAEAVEVAAAAAAKAANIAALSPWTPKTSYPTTSKPTARPTTARPTTARPTTARPTTASPTQYPTQYCFPDKATLQIAVNNYISQSCATTPTCATRTQYGEIGTWCVKRATNMAGLFLGASTFNSDISRWEVGCVTDMRAMFYQASNFNSDISSWNVSSVTNMNIMFRDASSFNSDISRWEVGRVKGMNGMFERASSFNRDLCPWGHKLPLNFGYTTYASSMFFGTGCPNKNSPTGRTGPWCATCPT